MDYSYKDFAAPYIEKALKVEIDKSYQDRILAFVKKLIQKKLQEKHHLKDNNQETKRFSTGYLGEAALEKLFDLKIIDWTIGDSSLYHVPDIPGYSVGIKSVEYGKFPIIFKKNYYPQIICVTDPQQFGTVYVCGLATTETLNTCQSDDLILDKNLRARGTKTGFYGFQQLSPISNLSDIQSYKKNSSTTYNEKPHETIIKKCPKCGNNMILRNGKFGQFIGCKGFPNCKYTENYTRA